MLIDQSTYLNFKEGTVHGRYVTAVQIITFLDTLNADFKLETLGTSVEGRPIQSVTIGSGKQRVLIWSQMHGNESTTTKALLDVLRFLEKSDAIAHSIASNCTLKIIPVLNPDGAEAYTRFNANDIDLNRDAQMRSQPESQVLRDVYEQFEPAFCFNLHDQRTIYNVGDTSKPATVSFLAPSHDQERSISESRKLSMQLIAAMNSELQQVISGQVGRYDDAFNANCIGDTFQMLNTPTVLFEAGHYQEDYERERTREYITYALIKALYSIAENKISSYAHEAYFEIPENNTLFYDVLIKNAQIIDASNAQDLGLLFSEVLKNGTIVFEARIEKTGRLDQYFGHDTYDCADQDDLDTLRKQSFWKLLKPKL